MRKKADVVRRTQSKIKNLAASGKSHNKWGYAPEHVKKAASTPANPKNMANLKLANQAKKRSQEARRMQQQQSHPFQDEDEEDNLEAAEELLGANLLLGMAQGSPRSGRNSQASDTAKGRVPAKDRDEFAYDSSSSDSSDSGDSNSGDSDDQLQTAKKSRASVTDTLRASDKSLGSTARELRFQKSKQDVPGHGRMTGIYSKLDE